jgi:hypothetical protein
MNKDELQAMLTVDPQDGGCNEMWDAMEVYAELVAAGVDPSAEYPRVAAHLRDCDPCSEDLAGVVAAVLATKPPRETAWRRRIFRRR